MTSRPELTGHASLFYNQKEAKKYNSSSRMIGVQREITERAIELLRLPDLNSTSTSNNGEEQQKGGGIPQLVLDIGCGSGLSGQVLEEKGHVWVGCDVSRDMLNVANERRQAQRDQEQQQEGLARMEEDGSNETNIDNESDDDAEEEDDDRGPSTGDLMHHVS